MLAKPFCIAQRRCGIRPEWIVKATCLCGGFDAVPGLYVQFSVFSQIFDKL